MSRHHRAQKWSTVSPKLRKLIKPTLPRQCVNCPHDVTPLDSWQVGHVQDAARGGRAVIGNAGPVHTYCAVCKHRCNQVSGGKLGASIVNSKRQTRKDIRSW